jgi:hypothetical protein
MTSIPAMMSDLPGSSSARESLVPVKIAQAEARLTSPFDVRKSIMDNGFKTILYRLPASIGMHEALVDLSMDNCDAVMEMRIREGRVA